VTERKPKRLSGSSVRDLLVMNFTEGSIAYQEDFRLRFAGNLWPRHLKLSSELVETFKRFHKEHEQDPAKKPALIAQKAEAYDAEGEK
jgi:hypothetical protein